MLSIFQTTSKHLTESGFLIKSAFGVSIVSLLILLPFAINNFLQGRIIGGVLVSCVSLLCFSNAWLGWHGKYALKLNLFAIVPAITVGIANAIVTLGPVGSYWAYLGIFAVYFILPLRCAKYANIGFLAVVIAAAVLTLDLNISVRFSAVLIGVSFFIYISNNEIDKTHTLLKQQLETDPLTGAFNRVKLCDSLKEAITQYEKKGTKATLCVLDIDHFKTINDTYGHDTGDKVLVEMSRFIMGMISSKDSLFRIGGEEFLILMDNTNANEGLKTADALRATIEELTLVADHKVTVSIGVTEIQTGYSWKEWMKLSDEKLYKAKQNGRNQVQI